MAAATIILLISTFLTIWFGSIIIACLIAKQAIPSLNFIVFAIGATGILAHFYGLY